MSGYYPYSDVDIPFSGFIKTGIQILSSAKGLRSPSKNMPVYFTFQTFNLFKHTCENFKLWLERMNST